VVSFLKVLAEVAPKAGPAAGRAVAVVLAEERLPTLAAALAETGDSLADCPARLLRTGAKDPLARLLYLLPTCPFQQALEVALLDMGVDLTPLYVERLDGKDHDLVLASIQALGRIGSELAIGALAGVLAHPSSQQRQAALQALVKAYHPSARAAVIRCLEDPLAANRVLALRVLGAAADPGASRAVVAAMRQPEFEKRDVNELTAWYRYLGTAPHPGVVELLGEQLTRRNLLRNRTLMTHQVLAARALGELGSPEARAVLEQAHHRGSLPPPVRHAIAAALLPSRGADV
jgi:HEAT repeat protein